MHLLARAQIILALNTPSRSLIELNNMHIEILHAEQKDLETILKLQKECYMSEAEIYNNYEIQPLKQDLESLIHECEKAVMLKAVMHSEIVGSIRGYIDTDTAFIGKLIVKRECQNMGIGRMLLDAMELNFSDCNRFELFTGMKSKKNLYLYDKLGYKEFKRQIVDEDVTLIYLEKPNE